MVTPHVAPAKKPIKNRTLKVRLTDEQHALLQAAADLQDLDISTWLRQVGLGEARVLLAQNTKKSA